MVAFEITKFLKTLDTVNRKDHVERAWNAVYGGYVNQNIRRPPWKPDDDIYVEFVTSVEDVLKLIVKGNDEKVREFTIKLWDFLVHKLACKTGGYGIGRCIEEYRSRELTEWFRIRFFEYCIWRSSEEFLANHKHLESTEGQVKGMN